MELILISIAKLVGACTLFICSRTLFLNKCIKIKLKNSETSSLSIVHGRFYLLNVVKIGINKMVCGGKINEFFIFLTINSFQLLF